MSAPDPVPLAVTLPRLIWGAADAPRSVLLVHGLGSSAATMWSLGVGFAAAGWNATAIDLRGHGAAPRTLDYRLTAFAADLAATAPAAGGAWDLVIGHSLGGATALQAASIGPDWARRLALLDPVLALTRAQWADVEREALAELGETSPDVLAAQHPRWHPNDVETKAAALRTTSPHAIRALGAQNEHWDLVAAAAALRVPTLVVGADPARGAFFAGATAARVLDANPRISATVLAGAGHSVHRDAPEDTLRIVRDWADAH